MYSSLLYLILVCGFTVLGYNLEDRLPLYKRGERSSTFGFSVAMHKTNNQPQNGLENSLLVIGSPTASALASQDNTKNPGGIFYCPVSTNGEDCVRVQMDEGPSSTMDNKTGQWLGVSLISQGEGKLLVTCAHRRASRWGPRLDEYERLCGKCFILNATLDNEIDEVSSNKLHQKFLASPCDGYDSLNFNVILTRTLGYSQTGVSLSSIGEEFVAGSPGSWAWSGGMFGSDLNFLYGGDSNNTFETMGCNYAENKDSPPLKCRAIPLRRDSYIGFSVTTSDAMNNYTRKESIYIAGAPKGNHTGAVVLYKKRPSSGRTSYLVPIMKDIIMGEHIGSSFGFSVAAVDLNGDGLDDLIVGAPQYYQYSNEGKHGGAVYIYLNDESKPFSDVEPQKFVGPLDSFFGYSIAPLGDIDQDGYNDFAVGSPYESTSGRIYIYRGSGDGVIKQSQVIDGKRYARSEKEGFGISLSGNVDIDNNKYPDLLVGTMKDQAILFRTRPIISVESSLVSSIELLDLRDPQCGSGRESSCFTLRYCFRYNARHKEYTDVLRLRYKLTLDSQYSKTERLESRVFFKTPQGRSFKKKRIDLIRAGEEICPGKDNPVYFNRNAKDILTPITVHLEYSLFNDSNDIAPENPGEPIFDMIDDPILDADYPSERNAVIKLATNCGQDGCQSNLKYKGSLPKQIFVGATEIVTLSLDVSNDAEDAHQASLLVKLPSRVNFHDFKVTESSGINVTCFTTNRGDTNFVTCLLGNPYYSGSKNKIEIYLNVTNLTPNVKQIEVEITGSTTSENPELQLLRLKSDIFVQMMLTLFGYGTPQQVRYDDKPVIGESAIRYLDDIGPLINYTYNIKNDGYKPATSVQLKVKFPHEIKNGKWLLYLISTSISAGGGFPAGECTGDVNPLRIKIPVALSRSKRAESAENPSSQAPSPRVASLSSPGVYVYHKTLTCNDKSASCINITCNVDTIPPKSTVSILFQARLWNYTFIEEFTQYDLLKVLTEAHLDNTENNVKIIGNSTSLKIPITVDHHFFNDNISASFPWWYILIGIIIALIVYTLIILILIKCGFFKRKRHPRHEHEQDEGAVLTEVKPKDDEEVL